MGLGDGDDLPATTPAIVLLSRGVVVVVAVGHGGRLGQFAHDLGGPTASEDELHLHLVGGHGDGRPLVLSSGR